MHTSPHLTCARVLNTVRLSGITYSLTETPFSAYLCMRKKFTKGFSPTTSSSTSSADTNRLSHYTHNPVSEIENAKHNHTKHQLSEKEAELSKLTKHYEKLLNEAKIEHINLSSSITNLNQELATEIDEHAQSEQALRRHEEKVESIHLFNYVKL